MIEGISMDDNSQPTESGADEVARKSPDTASPEALPAGGAGADSGAVEVAGIDADDHAEVQNISNQNDIPGVGTRAADGSMESAPPRGEAADDHSADNDATGEGHQASDDGDEDPKDDTRRLIEEFEPGVHMDSAD